MIQKLYITWAMEKPSGRGFYEESLRFSEQGYVDRRILIEHEIAEMKLIAERYIVNLDKIEVRTAATNL
ncbi:hypothetical protein ABE504_27065 [Paenibacillus oryzisoli]|uniref:hypothetical protein n=1 Tax=Paenibacillus oryzisoli TaxID=1850517 RepID=UPI003D27C8E8